MVNNVDVAVETAQDAIKDALIRQSFSPVRWTETIEWLAAQGVTDVLELGAGKVLAGLIKRIDKNLITSSVNDAASLTRCITVSIKLSKDFL